jgi:DNA modification methylase
MDGLRQIADESVHCVVTSPPYYGLRSYGTEPQVWGGDPNCQHAWGSEAVAKQGNYNAGFNERWGNSPGDKKQESEVGTTYSQGAFCHCGAWRGDLGLEPTPELFIQHLVGVFREIRRVLRKDGTLWLNLGDCYATAANGRSAADIKALGKDNRTFRDKPFSTVIGNFKGKDLMMMPSRLAIALQEDGWWLRS